MTPIHVANVHSIYIIGGGGGEEKDEKSLSLLIDWALNINHLSVAFISPVYIMGL